MPNGQIYNIIYGPKYPGGAEKIFCLRGIANGQEMEMTFRLIGGKWKLTKLVE
jgi:hypothetical protein